MVCVCRCVLFLCQEREGTMKKESIVLTLYFSITAGGMMRLFRSPLPCKRDGNTALEYALTINHWTYVFDNFLEQLAFSFTHQRHRSATRKRQEKEHSAGVRDSERGLCSCVSIAPSNGSGSCCASNSVDVLLVCVWHVHVDHLRKREQETKKPCIN